jgi:Do/DeqQ family serine protease
MRRFAKCVVMLLALSPVAGWAQAQRVVPRERGEVMLSYAPVVKRVAPAVVNVYASRIEQRPNNPLFDDPIFRQFFGGGGPPRGRVAQSLGSGVIVDASGLVVTNHHVIEGMTDVKVSLADKREFEAEIVLRDQRTDLAVLRIKGGSNFPVLELGDSDALEVGDFALAVGNPFGVGQTVTQGIVSALARTQVGISDFGFFIQTDAAINPGNSGGALVDLNARLVGINSAIYSRSGGSMGIGFAIPVNMVKVVIATAKGGGKIVKRPWLGATLQSVSHEIAESLGLERSTGALVAEIVDRSPAAESGLKRGDIITSVDGQAVDDPEALGYRLATKPLGGVASLGVQRGGKSVIAPLKLQSAPETPPRETIKLTGNSPFAGATAMNLSPAVQEELGGAVGREGVVVADVEESSIAANVGIQKGDIVLAVNDAKIARTSDLKQATQNRQRLWKLTINRGGQVITSVFGG